MARTDPLKPWFDQTQKSWQLLTQGAAWVLGLIGGFLLPPPAGMAGETDKTWLRFAQFFVAALIGLIFLGVLKWKLKKHAKGWWVAGFASLLSATLAFFAYQYFSAEWTVDYEGAKVVIGSEYTPYGQAYAATNASITAETLVANFTLPHLTEVWTRKSINQRRLKLAAVYVSCLPLFTVCVIAVVQAIRCFTGSRAKKID
jgi:hypothetical protein